MARVLLWVREGVCYDGRASPTESADCDFDERLRREEEAHTLRADLKETCQTRGGSIHDQELLVVVVVVVMGCSGQSVGVHWVRTQEGSGHGKNAGGAEDLILRGITLV